MPKLTVDKIHDLLKECDKIREPFLTRAKRYWRLVYEPKRIEPTTQMPISSNHPDVQENHIRAKLLDMRSILLKNNPTFRVQATKPTDIDLSDEVTKFSYKKWKETNAMTALSNSQFEASITGLSVMRYNEINGKEKFINVPLINFWHDPSAQEIGEGWLCYKTWHTAEKLKRFFSSRKVSSAVGSDDLAPSTEKKDVLGPTGYEGAGGLEPPEGWGKDMCALYEFWMPTSLNGEKEQEGGEAERTVNNWEVYYIVENKIIDIRTNPFTRVLNVMQEDGSVEERRVGHGMPPFVVQRCYWKKNQDGYLGFYNVEGIVEHLEGIQWSINEAARSLMIMTRRAAMPPYTEEENSLSEPGMRLEWRPGEVISYKSGKSPPVPLAQGLESIQPQYLHQHSVDMMGEISGIRKFMTGEMPKGTSHTPQGTIMFSQEASFIRMPDIVRELDKAIISMGKLILGNLQQFETPGTWKDISLAGEQVWMEWTEKHITTEFNLEVVSGMTTILRDIDRQQNATNIYQSVMRVLATPTVPLLKATKQWLLMLDEPSGYGYLALIDEEMERLQQLEELAAMQAQAAQAAPAEQIGLPAEEAAPQEMEA